MTQLSGAAKRRAKVAAGLPRYTATELAARQAARSRYNKASKQRLLDEVAALKVARGCADCGYNAHSEALDFDHLPGAEKIANVAKMLNRGYPRERVFTEIAKCEVVCANCHRVRTATRRQDL